MAEQDQPDSRGQGGEQDKRVAFWRDELERSRKRERNYRKRAHQTLYRYDEEADEETGDIAPLLGTRFNILWANTETLRPSLYQGPPRALVSRRYRDIPKTPEDQARLADTAAAAKVLERALEFSVDQYDFDEMAEECTNDALLPGRMQARVHYRAHSTRVNLQAIEKEDGSTAYARGGLELSPDDYETDGEGAFVREISLQQVFCTHVAWDDFFHSKARKWRKVWWVAFRDYQNKDQIAEVYGKAIAEKVEYKHERLPTYDDEGERQRYAGDDGMEEPEPVCEVYSIWNKRTRRVILYTDGLDDRFLGELDDPLGLNGFFPCPAPVLSVRKPGSLVPVPEYVMYQHQADELDRITARITALVEAIKAVGVYDAALGDEIQKVFQQPDLTLVAVQNFSAFLEKGGLRSIEWLQVEQYSKAIDQLLRQRAQVITIIYEVTGISDLLRGATDPRETASAQNLKAQFGSRRLSARQHRHQRFFRDLYRLKAEVIAEHFTREQLQLMTGVELTESAMRLLRSDVLRDFLIDVETRATAAPDEAQEKQDVNELFNAMGAFLERSQALPPAVQGQLLLYGIRRYRAGRDIEETVQQAMEKAAQQPPPPNPEVIRAQADAQKAQREQQRQDAVAKVEQGRKDKVALAEQQRKTVVAREELRIKREEMQGMLAIRREESEAKSKIAERDAQVTRDLREMDGLIANERKLAEPAKEEKSMKPEAGNGKSVVVVEQRPEAEWAEEFGAALVAEVGKLLADGKDTESAKLLADVLSELKKGNKQREAMQKKADQILALRERESARLQ